MKRDARCLQLVSQPAFEAQGKLGLHPRTQRSRPRECVKHDLYAAVEIAAVQMQHTNGIAFIDVGARSCAFRRRVQAH